MKKLTLILTIITLFAAHQGNAQKWMGKLKVNVNEQLNFYEIQEAFYVQHKDVSIDEYQRDYKKFKRWETFMEPRINEQGYIPSRIFWSENQRLNSIRRAGLKNNSNWVALGPAYTPLWSVNNIWNETRSGTGRVECIEFHPTDSLTIWVGVHSGGLWKTIDGGENWHTTTDELPSIGISDIVIHPSDPDILYIGTGDRDTDWTYSIGLLKSTDGGETFEETGLNYEIQENEVITEIIINPQDPNVLIVSTTEGIYKSINTGIDWTLNAYGNYRDLAQKPGDPNVIYASTYSFNGGARLYRSEDAGDNFIELNTGITAGVVSRIAIGLTAANPEIIYIVSCNASPNQSNLYGVYRSEDAGDTWTEMVSGNDINLLGRSLTGIDTEGYGWYTLSIEVSQINPDQLYVGGVNIWRSDDGGLSWDIKTTESANIPGVTRMWVDHHELRINPYSNTFFTAHDGGVYKSDDQGDSFTDITDGLNINQMYRIGCSASDEGMVVAGCQDQFGMLHRDDEWVALYTGEASEHFIDYYDPDVLYCYGFGFGMIRSVNGGYSYTNINPPGVSNNHWLAPTIMHPTDPNTIYLGINGVYKSTNRGDSWETLTPSLTGAYELESLAVAPSNDNYMYASSPISMWRSKDGGSEWTKIDGPLPSNALFTDIAISSDDPEHVWVSVARFIDNTKVFESFDGGTTWINKSLNLPNVPVHSIVHDSRDADGVYVGTDLGIFYINNTMDEWIDFSVGLPNVVINEIEIQYSSDKLRAGTYGRGLWESDLYDIGLSIPNIENIRAFRIIPNPVRGRLEVSLDLIKPEHLTLRMRNTIGQEVMRTEEIVGSGKSSVELDCSSLTEGIYILELIINNQRVTSRKIIKL